MRFFKRERDTEMQFARNKLAAFLALVAQWLVRAAEWIEAQEPKP